MLNLQTDSRTFLDTDNLRCFPCPIGIILSSFISKSPNNWAEDCSAPNGSSAEIRLSFPTSTCDGRSLKSILSSGTGIFGYFCADSLIRLRNKSMFGERRTRRLLVPPKRLSKSEHALTASNNENSLYTSARTLLSLSVVDISMHGFP